MGFRGRGSGIRDQGSGSGYFDKRRRASSRRARNPGRAWDDGRARRDLQGLRDFEERQDRQDQKGWEAWRRKCRSRSRVRFLLARKPGRELPSRPGARRNDGGRPLGSSFRFSYFTTLFVRSGTAPARPSPLAPRPSPLTPRRSPLTPRRSPLAARRSPR
jgi:hypothetical protein